VVVVVGYKEAEVVEHVISVRPDAVFATNRDYATTGTAASLAIGAQHVDGDVISLDGDLLVAPLDLAAFLHHADGLLLGVTPRASATAVGIQLDDHTRITRMGFDVESSSEWSGLVRLDAEAARALGNGHVFESLLSLLPAPARSIDCVEIDEPEDLVRAEQWLARRTSAGGTWTSR
jgi:choline kinase